MSSPLIAHIIYRFDIGGLESVLVNMINTMPEQAYRHVIISLTESSGFKERINRDDVDVICLHKQAGNDLRIHFKIWKLFRTLSPQIVHTYNIATLEYNFIAFLTGVKKRIHAEHGRDIFDIDGSNKKYQMLRRLMNPFVTQWIPVSKELADWLVEVVRLPQEKVKLIYNGIDLQLYTPKLKSNNTQFVVGTVGRLAVVKDQFTLLKAAKKLLRDYPELKTKLRIVIVGDGELFQSLNDFIVTHELEKNITLLGARDDVAKILQTFDVFALPSLVEGIPLTILETMATALPVIATKVGGNPELIEENVNGFLIQPKDIDALANTIKHYIDHPQSVAEHGACSRKKVERSFSLEQMTEQYLQVYT